MTKNRTMRVAALLLVLTLITSCFVGGTFAKYTTTKTATAEASVAKWSFDVNGIDMVTNNIEFNGAFPNLVKPGDKGQLKLVLENTSDVDATYAIDFTETIGNVPMTFKVDGVPLADIPATDIVKGTPVNIVIDWEWAGTDNAADTAVTATSISLAAKITAAQK